MYVYVYVCVRVCVCACMYVCDTQQLTNYRGDSVTGKVTASAWMDRKTVMVMSTNSQPSSCGIVTRKQRDGSTLEVPCLASVISYNNFMGGVDCEDQLRGYYCCRSKSRTL